MIREYDIWWYRELPYFITVENKVVQIPTFKVLSFCFSYVPCACEHQ